MFEQGDIENLKSYNLKQFIRKRLNEKLVELGYRNEREHFEFDNKNAAKKLGLVLPPYRRAYSY